MRIKLRLTFVFIFFVITAVTFVTTISVAYTQRHLTGAVLQNFEALASVQESRVKDMVVLYHNESMPHTASSAEVYLSDLAAMAQDYTGMGRTGEVEVARRDENGDALFLTPLRFEENAVLKKITPKEEVDSPIIQALQKKEITIVGGVDYRNHNVISVTRYIPETDWGLVVKIDEDELLAPVRDLRIIMIFISTLTVLFAALTGWAVAKSITDPLQVLATAVTEISKGKLDVRLEGLDTPDEIGDLARAFDRTIISLKLAMREMGKEKNLSADSANTKVSHHE